MYSKIISLTNSILLAAYVIIWYIQKILLPVDDFRFLFLRKNYVTIWWLQKLVSKEAAQKFDGERFNLRKLN